jgi:hypothetical protein
VRYLSDTKSDTFIHRHLLSSIYWSGFGATEGLKTDEDLTRERFHSAEWLFHAGKSEHLRGTTLNERLEIADALKGYLGDPHEALSSTAVRVDQEMRLRDGQAINVARWMLATGRWKAETTDPLFSKPLKIAA